MRTMMLALLGARRGLWATIALAVVVAIWRTIDLRYHVVAGLVLTVPWVRTDTACDGLLAGCIVALLYHRPTWRKTFQRCFAPPVMYGMLIVLGVLLATEYQPIMFGTICYEAMIITIPLVLVATLTHPQSVLSRALELAPLRWVGRLSYSLYLWQQLFITHPQKVSLGLAHRLPFNVVFAVAAAVASYLLVERPFLSLKERFARHG